MKKLILVATCLLLSSLANAQQPAASADTWGRSPPASDDRFSNPKSKLYAGPDGWYNFGEVRAEVSNAAKTAYAYKGGFNSTQHMFVAVDSSQLRVLHFDFGVDRPAPGVYQISSKGDHAKKTVNMSLVDLTNKKLIEWSSNDKSGSVTVSLVNGFLYFKCRGVVLQPAGIHNTGELKRPMTLGFEGAVKQQ